MTSSFTFARVRGIPIGAHYSWLLVAALVIYSLASYLFPHTYPGLSTATYVVMAIVAALLFFTSILLHELGHAFQALKEGMRIDGIILWLFGGVARFRGMFPSAGAELRIALAGPAVSAVLGLAFLALSLVGAALGAPEPVRGVADYLARINGLVLAFNLVPALPLDGGRVLRAWLWQRQRSFSAATSSAATAGRAFGFLLIAVAVLNYLAGMGAGAIWFAFLGWFLVQAAAAEASMVHLYQVLGRRSVRDLMTPEPVAVTADISVRDFLERAAATGAHPLYPVVEGERLVGVVALESAVAVDETDRDRRTVRDIVHPVGPGRVVPVDSDTADALEVLERWGRAPVVDDGRLVGVLSLSDVRRAVRIEQARGPVVEPRARRAGVLVWALVTIIMLVAAGFLYRPPLVAFAPGPTLDVTGDIRISGMRTDEVDGEYLLTSVQLQRPSAIGALYSWAILDREVATLSELVPEGQNVQEYFRQQRRIFRESRMIAAAAAARAAGMRVPISGDGAEIQAVVPNSPADGALRPGDVVVAVDGEKVTTAFDLQRLIGARPAGTDFTLTVQRDGSRRTVTVTSARLPAASQGFVGLGVVIATRNLDIDLPFEISFKERNIGGPSAGLAYALATYDLIERGDLARGRVIGATGTIDLRGEVGPVGGIDAKTEALERARADIFLVPEQELQLVPPTDIRVHGVTDLREAINALGGSA